MRRSDGPRAAVFAVGTDSVQVTWAELGQHGATVTVGGERVDLSPEEATAPGAVAVTLTRPERVRVEWRDGGRGRSIDLGTVHPLRSPPGPELARFATIGDLHIGAVGFDHDGSMREDPPPLELHPVRCARAAWQEAVAWGAERLLVKGDCTQLGWRASWEELGRLLAPCPVPISIIPGNHDTYPGAGRVDPFEALTPYGLEMVRHLEVTDLPGLRVVAVDTNQPYHGRGRLGHLTEDVCDAVADARRAGRPALVVGHHHPNPTPVGVFWPNGVDRGEAARFLRAVATANSAVLYTCGHTHRHRRRRLGGVTVVEVGSPKDYPGTWAGYRIYEGGICQEVRRVARADCIAWTERTRTAAYGVWGRWSPGRLGDRCFVHRW